MLSYFLCQIKVVMDTALTCTQIDISLLPNLFPEIYKQVIDEGIKCKFRNCLHVNDEGCNLNKSFERYPFYKEMIESSKSHYYQNQED